MTAQASLFDLPVTMTAVLAGADDCYRLELRRIWDASRPLLVACMLNPSTADHRANDPTILTLMHFAKLWGYGGLLVVNLYAFRSPSPAEMRLAADPIGPGNDEAIINALRYAREAGRPVLAAWGNGAGLERVDWFLDTIDLAGVDLICLGTTLLGQPKHPLARGHHRIPRDQQPIRWRGAA